MSDTNIPALLEELREVDFETLRTIAGKCPACGGDVRFNARPMPLENTGGRDGFYEYDYDCPHCGHNMEGVLH